MISPSRNNFKCFGCGETGDAIDLYEKMYHLDKRSAIKKLCDDLSIPYEGDSTSDMVFRLNQWYLSFRQGMNDRIKHMLSERDITESELSKWGIGYCNQPLTVEDIDYQIGVLNSRGSIMFHNRITLPIYNRLGHLTGFSGRHLKKGGKPKYVNSADCLVYNKSSILYAQNYAGRHIVRFGSANVVEGQFDCISMHRVGMENSVGSCGTAFTVQQARLLSDLTDTGRFIFDGDAAGVKALSKAVPNAINAGLKVYAVLLDGEDADQACRSREDARKYFKRHTLGYAQVMDIIHGKDTSLDQAVKNLSNMTNPVLQGKYVVDISRQYGVPQRQIYRRLNQLGKKQTI